MQTNDEWKNEIVWGGFDQHGYQIICAYHPKSNLKVFRQVSGSKHNTRVACIQMLEDQLANLPRNFKAPEVGTVVVTTLEFK